MAGRPSTATTDDNIERVGDMVVLDRRLTIDEVANRLQISHGSAYEIIHNRLGFPKRWKKYIEKLGDYVEKWCYYKFSVFIEMNFVSVLRIIIDSPTYKK